jgi:hypothetical protein
LVAFHVQQKNIHLLILSAKTQPLFFFGRPKRYARKTDENYYRKKQSFFGSLSGAYKTMILFVSKHAAFVFLVERFLPQHWSKDVFVKPTI